MRDICFLGKKVQGMYCGKHVFKVEFFRPEKTVCSPCYNLRNVPTFFFCIEVEAFRFIKN